ncbi:hypothetical protein WR25_14545 [Diploscapter pachys]|uniref:Essential MCU regulator, mitochondrial n=1 Tax=Diploscapter pachys TaxID=2018661 RepID=A0A2A2L4X6_9BILA|nr:hypothetical protein WR25_14545 [Diploscapter pachys]
MSFQAAGKSIVKLAFQGVQHFRNELKSPPFSNSLRGKVNNEPLQDRIKLFKLFFVTTFGISLGATIANVTAIYLERNNIFTHSDDDDDD